VVIRDTAIASIGSKTEEDRAAIAGTRAEEEITAAKNVKVERRSIATAVTKVRRSIARADKSVAVDEEALSYELLMAIMFMVLSAIFLLYSQSSECINDSSC
jgi:hypothetical protein